MIKLYHGECISIMKKLFEKGIRVDTVITDPPYELDFHLGGQQKRAKDFTKLGNNIDFMSNGFDPEALNWMIKLCKTPNILIFCSNKQISELMTYFESLKLSTTLLVWKKTNACPLGKGKHISDLEFVVYARGKNAPFNNAVDYSKKYKLQMFPFVNGKKRMHPAQKPLELVQNYIELHSFEGQCILDPYMGSGTTGVAAKKLKRDFIGIELNKNYCKIAEERIKCYEIQ